MARRVIAIGDIHGCARALRVLLDAIAVTPDDELVTLGDVIDRGPDSREVVDLLMELRGRCRLRPILGNHEEMMLSVLRGQSSPDLWIREGGSATLDSYGFVGDLSVVPPAHVEFLEGCLDHYETDTHLFVHANLLPDLPLDQQPARMLRWTSLDAHLPGKHISGKTAVVGHTTERSGEIFSLTHLKCIDTYCYGGGWLTALDTVSGESWQANQVGQLR
jgi:serine/threonine protein phosphatase 1